MPNKIATKLNINVTCLVICRGMQYISDRTELFTIINMSIMCALCDVGNTTNIIKCVPQFIGKQYHLDVTS